MKLVNSCISLHELHKMSENMFQKLVKAVVDIEKEIMVVDAVMHADQELLLLEEHKSEQKNLWGIHLYPDNYGQESFIVFDSMINLRPSFGNRTRGVDDVHTQQKIKAIVTKLVKP